MQFAHGRQPAGLVRELASRVKPVPDFFAEVKALLGEAAVA